MSSTDITVLLVDDDDMIRDCVTAYLEDEGFRVHAAECGEDALAAIESISPAVCISDMRLPGMSGEEFIVKAHALCPKTGYLLHTGMVCMLSDDLRRTGMTADDVLLKPVHDLAKLATRIRNIYTAGRNL